MAGRGAGVAGPPGCLREKGEKFVIRIGWEIRMENWERGTGEGDVRQGGHGCIQCCLVPVLRARASLSSIFFSSSCHPAKTALTCLTSGGGGGRMTS